MKNIILTLSILLISQFSNSQIGVLTLDKNDRVKTEMWYTINQKGRENNLYITYDNQETAAYKLEELLSQFDMEVDLPTGEDQYGDPYWTVEQENGYLSDIYFIEEKDYKLWTITIVSVEMK